MARFTSTLVLRARVLTVILCMACSAVGATPVEAATDLRCLIQASGNAIVRANAPTKSIPVGKLRQQLLKQIAKGKSGAVTLRAQINATQKSNLSAKKKKIRVAALRLKLEKLLEAIKENQAVLKALGLCRTAKLANLPSGIPSVVEVAELSIPAGSQINVPDDLTIRSRGDVTISGSLIAQGSHGQSIAIESEGNATILGVITAGAAPSGTNAVATLPSVTAESGEKGGDLMIRADNISIGAAADLRAGNGGLGGAASSVISAKAGRLTSAGAGSPLSVVGGNGGAGGDIILQAPNGDLHIDIPTDGQPSIITGNGGEGGKAVANTVGEVTEVSGLAAQGGAGGDAGELKLVFKTLSGLQYTTSTLTQRVVLGNETTLRSGLPLLNLDEASTKVFGGGVGGDAGSAFNGTSEQAAQFVGPNVGDFPPNLFPTRESFQVAQADGDESCAPKGGTPGRACTPPVGSKGGNGFFCPGRGSDVTCKDPKRDATGNANGGTAVTTGGEGGRLKALVSISTTLVSGEAEFGLGLNINALVTPDGRCGKGGNGGFAFSQAGHGGPVGGSGGGAQATGGKGGDAHFTPEGADINLILTIGGAGGRADAIGGNGRNGTNCCPDKPGQSGGSSGEAKAIGGAGGNGSIQQAGGSANALSGNSGSGGDGVGPGFKGAVGEAKAQIGESGDSTFPAPNPPRNQSILPVPSKSEQAGTEGKDGGPCVAATPTPAPTATPTPPQTAPQCVQGTYSGGQGCGLTSVTVSGAAIPPGGSVTISDNPQPFNCSSASGCGCVATGVEILGLGGHRCCLNCASGAISIRCTNELGGVCTQTLSR